MRNCGDAETIADRRMADMDRANAEYVAASEVRMSAIAFARIGPPEPVGWLIYPGCRTDRGLIDLRNRCYANLRKRKQENRYG